MKKCLILWLFVFPLLVCGKNTVVISGKIEMDKKMVVELKLLENNPACENPFSYDIPVNSDGAFRFEMEISEPLFANLFVKLGEGREVRSFLCPVYIKKEKGMEMLITVSSNSCTFHSKNRNWKALSDYCNYNIKKIRGIYTNFGEIGDYKQFIEGFYRKAEEVIQMCKPDKEVGTYLQVWGYVVYLNTLYDFSELHSTMAGKPFDAPDHFYTLIGNPSEILDRDELFLISDGMRCAGSWVDRKAASPRPEVKIQVLKDEFKNPIIRDGVIESILGKSISENGFDTDSEEGMKNFKQLLENISDPGKRENLLNDIENKRYRIVGAPAPDLKFLDQEGKEVTLADFKGKYVFVDLWASWCAPCCAEVPYLKKLEEEYKDITFVSISIDSDKGRWESKMKELGMKGIMLWDKKGKIIKVMGVRGIPYFLIYGPDGKLYNNRAPKPGSAEIRNILNQLK